MPSLISSDRDFLAYLQQKSSFSNSSEVIFTSTLICLGLSECGRPVFGLKPSPHFLSVLKVYYYTDKKSIGNAIFIVRYFLYGSNLVAYPLLVVTHDPGVSLDIAHSVSVKWCFLAEPPLH